MCSLYLLLLLRSRRKRRAATTAAAMIADVHRTLLQGGVFLYPPTAGQPRGKLRLLYECGPLAYVCAGAGGRAVDADGNDVLDVVPEELHARSPIVVGSAEDVTEYAALL